MSLGPLAIAQATVGRVRRLGGLTTSYDRPTQYAGRQVFYYCRVTLATREMAWASPIWIGKERP